MKLLSMTRLSVKAVHRPPKHCNRIINDSEESKVMSEGNTSLSKGFYHKLRVRSMFFI